MMNKLQLQLRIYLLAIIVLLSCNNLIASNNSIHLPDNKVQLNQTLPNTSFQQVCYSPNELINCNAIYDDANDSDDEDSENKCITNYTDNESKIFFKFSTLNQWFKLIDHVISPTPIYLYIRVLKI